MYLQFALKSYFDGIKNISGYNFLNLMSPEEGVATNKYYFYDPALQFDERFHKRIAYKEYSEFEDPFICAMWNRGVISPLPEQPRQFQAFNVNTDAGIYERFTIKNVNCNVSVCWISNSPEYMMSFEEFFIVNYDRTATINANYKIPVMFQPVGNIVSVNQISKTFKVSSLVSLNANDILKIFSSTGNDGTYTVVSSVQVVDGTVITVIESIPNSTADGSIVKSGGFMTTTAKIFIKDIEFSDYNKLEPTNRGEIIFAVQSMNVQYPVIYSPTAGSGGNNFGKIIKQIDLKVKNVQDFVDLEMVPEYEEFIIEP